MEYGVKLTSISAVKALLQECGIAPLKQLGQNFLVDAGMLDKIADAAELSSGDTVLEIGPGLGALTQRLAARAGRVVAVEIDRGMVRALEKTLLGCDNVEVVHEDVLKCDLGTLGLGDGFAVVANLPYYVTTPIIMKLLESAPRPSRMVFMLQKEVAERMAAGPGSKAYGSLSIAVQMRARVSVVAHVPPACFYPRPDVDSIVLRLDLQAADWAEGVDEERFFELVRAAFAMRRKTLANNLAAVGIPREETAAALEGMGLGGSARAEELSPRQFAVLAKVLS